MNKLNITRLIVTGSIILMPGITPAHEVGGHAWSAFAIIHRLFHALSGYEIFYLGSVVFIAIVLNRIMKSQRDF